jgi:hypothetical protein
MLTVLLKHDVDEDYIDKVVDAIGMVRGVMDVVLGVPNDANTFAARRVSHEEIRERLRRALQMDLNNGDFYYDLIRRPRDG